MQLKFIQKNPKYATDHEFSNSLYYLATFYIETGNYKDAIPILNQSLSIRENSFGVNSKWYLDTLKALEFAKEKSL